MSSIKGYFAPYFSGSSFPDSSHLKIITDKIGKNSYAITALFVATVAVAIGYAIFRFCSHTITKAPITGTGDKNPNKNVEAESNPQDKLGKSLNKVVVFWTSFKLPDLFVKGYVDQVLKNTPDLVDRAIKPQWKALLNGGNISFEPLQGAKRPTDAKVVLLVVSNIPPPSNPQKLLGDLQSMQSEMANVINPNDDLYLHLVNNSSESFITDNNNMETIRAITCIFPKFNSKCVFDLHRKSDEGPSLENFKHISNRGAATEFATKLVLDLQAESYDFSGLSSRLSSGAPQPKIGADVKNPNIESPKKDLNKNVKTDSNPQDKLTATQQKIEVIYANLLYTEGEISDAYMKSYIGQLLAISGEKWQALKKNISFVPFKDAKESSATDKVIRVFLMFTNMKSRFQPYCVNDALDLLIDEGVVLEDKVSIVKQGVAKSDDLMYIHSTEYLVTNFPGPHLLSDRFKHFDHQTCFFRLCRKSADVSDVSNLGPGQQFIAKLIQDLEGKKSYDFSGLSSGAPQLKTGADVKKPNVENPNKNVETGSTPQEVRVVFLNALPGEGTVQDEYMKSCVYNELNDAARSLGETARKKWNALKTNNKISFIPFKDAKQLSAINGVVQAVMAFTYAQARIQPGRVGDALKEVVDEGIIYYGEKVVCENKNVIKSDDLMYVLFVKNDSSIIAGMENIKGAASKHFNSTTCVFQLAQNMAGLCDSTSRGAVKLFITKLIEDLENIKGIKFA